MAKAETPLKKKTLAQGKAENREATQTHNKEFIMPRFILSTVGTSILTNLIDRKESKEANWWNMLRDSANLKSDELEEDTAKVLSTLAKRALNKILEDDVAINRRISAELNGLYGIYGGRLSCASQDQHYLICTDTAQGQKTGELIQGFLEKKGFHAGIVTPAGLSTQDTESFTTGIKELIRWLEENVPEYRGGYRVIFNLVGGFKSLQGYMNTFGAFYADEVVYIFEAQTADLIKIPRLPIQIDDTVIQDHLVQFALMDAGKLYPIDELEGIPETLLEYVEDLCWIVGVGTVDLESDEEGFIDKRAIGFPTIGIREHLQG